MAAQTETGQTETGQIATGQTETGWLRPALALVAAITLLRWLLLAFDHTDLYVDESQYWLWGQEFAFGYYSKPPLIGWVIGAVTSLTSDSIFWVRMPGAALHGVTALVLAALAARLYGRRAAVLTAAAYATLPFTALGSLLISTDTVMAPFFAAALYFHQRLLETRAARFALLAGAMGGMAFMAKYIALFFLAGVALAALRKDGRIGWRNAALLALAFAAVISPNIWWNLTHKMTTFSHTVDNIGWVREDNPLASLRPLATLRFVLEQFGVFGPVLLAALLITLRRLPVQAAFAVPVLLVITLQSVLGRAESNWTVSAYFVGTVLAIGMLRQHPRWLRASFVINGAVSLTLPLLVIFPTLNWNGAPLLERQLGRAAMSRQIIALAHQAGDVPIYADRRDVLADLFYTGRDSGLQFFAPRPQGRPMHHYEQRYPLPPSQTGPILMVTSTPPVCAGQAMPLDATGGAYRKWQLAAYLINAECLHHE